MEDLRELCQFLKPEQRLDLKAVALSHVLSLTGSAEGKEAILSLKELLISLLLLTRDSNQTVAKDSVLSLINLTADEVGATQIYRTAHEETVNFPLVDEAVQRIIDPASDLADPWCMVLSNLTRVPSLVQNILDQLDSDEKTLLDLGKAFANINYNQKKSNLHYLGPIFCNLTQTKRGREILCDSQYNLLDHVLPFAKFEESLVRRGGTIGILKNLSFDPVYHDRIMDEDQTDILTAILYPLCGPEEFADDEMDNLPLDLQYLPETKCRERDPDLRKMLLESLLQLCATKRSREWLRQWSVYPILREYHKWETQCWMGGDKECLLACENVVDILIKTEEEIGLDNYKDVDVPSDIAEKFIREDTDYVNAVE